MPFIATLKDFDETAGDLDLPPLSSDFAPRDGDPIPESDASNPKEAAGALKTPFRHMPVGVLYEDAAVFALGAQKYGDFNWRDTDVRGSVYYEAALRHLFAWFEGETDDPESGISHLAHVRANCAILMDACDHGSLLDDRPGDWRD